MLLSNIFKSDDHVLIVNYLLLFHGNNLINYAITYLQLTIFYDEYM